MPNIKTKIRYLIETIKFILLIALLLFSISLFTDFSVLEYCFELINKYIYNCEGKKIVKDFCNKADISCENKIDILNNPRNRSITITMPNYEGNSLCLISCDTKRVKYYDNRPKTYSAIIEEFPAISRNEAKNIIDNLAKQLELPNDLSMEFLTKWDMYSMWEGAYIWMRSDYKYKTGVTTIGISYYTGELIYFHYTDYKIPPDNAFVSQNDFVITKDKAIELALKSFKKHIPVLDAYDIYSVNSIYIRIEYSGENDKKRLNLSWEIAFLLDKKYIETAKLKGDNVPNYEIPEEIIMKVNSQTGDTYLENINILAGAVN
ncbi:MAG: hypothetical protein L3V56_10820 [Candidatus Magnetoovum sp. WYHC-5]|nr:hypothetical protein [Candidatus Magnetoovum sp. WYHC-5]